MLDLATIDTPAASESGFEIELEYLGKPAQAWVTVRGDLSPTVKKWQLSIGNRFRIKEFQEKRRGKGDGPDPMTEADFETGLRGASVRVCGFRGITFKGEPLAYSPDAAYDLVRRHPPFGDQILEASSDVTNFTTGSVNA